MGVWKSLARRAARKAAGAIEKALFGDGEEKPQAEPEKPDPFAKLKAAEAEKKAREREGKR